MTCRIPTGLEPALGILGCNCFQGIGNGCQQSIEGAGLGSSQELFDLRPHPLDGVKIRTIRGKEPYLGPSRLDRRNGFFVLMSQRLSSTTMSPGLSVGTRICRTYSRNTSADVAPSMAMQTVDPSSRIEEIMVVVHQCPCGVSSTIRWPFFARPRRRVIFVFAPDSSRNTSLDRSISFCVAFHSSRACFTSGRSCSLARSDFF